MSGSIHPRLAAELDQARRAWVTDPGVADGTLTRMGEIAVRFARYLTATGYTTVTELDDRVCAAFINAPTRSGTTPSVNTRHFRRTTIRTWLRTMRTLGIDAPDPTIDLRLPARTGRAVRPLTDTEITLARIASFHARAHDWRRPAAWALAEATAVTSEIAQLTARHVHDDGTNLTITLPGARSAAPRQVLATGWGSDVLRQRLAEIGPDEPIAYRGRHRADSGAAQASISNQIGVVLVAAGLSPNRVMKIAG
jgi:integrase/recombinase XerC